MTHSKVPTAEQPLAGVKILEFSTMVTCSLASMTLAAQGAEVIKIEPPLGGDVMRHLGHQKNGISALFHNCNRGKRSLAIDLKSSAGVDAVTQLAMKADLVMHNYRPGVMDRMGLGSTSLRGINNRLTYIAVTGFGNKGPMSGDPAYDHVIQAMSGITDLQGDEESNFSFVRTLLCDKITAYTVCQAATAALLARATTGEGQHIDVSMLHACLAFVWPDGMMHHTLHDDDVIAMSPVSDYYQTLDLKDGSIAVAALQDKHWEALLPLIGYPELVDNPMFKTMGARLSNMSEVLKVLKSPRQDVGVAKALEILRAADVPCGPCEHRSDIAHNPQVNAIGALETYVAKHLGSLTAPTPPVQFAGALTTQALPSPTLGEQSRDILREIGWSENRIDDLVSQKIVHIS
ncbi:CoA transferase [Porticoccaceae bacterium]|jgi:crotonobetainyl-CoA:carnitine CoA-transferase CaiB-like acyl-CoA transferase|nr:CoA transferase [Porticoccaceae bacterium]MDA7577717.1 CoA transferase [bacterium]MBT7947344.1 CoA transferase [Porticoccaceae bacterium]MDA7589323.1 CoA transferase [Porticoccaceae bacterium]MDA9592415.1 CoA transferase [Porticoccaceae bacterium]